MSYQITITKITPVQRIERGQSVEVGQVKDDGFMNGIKAKWEYMPDRVYDSTEEKEIFTQIVDDLDLVAVIGAINKIPSPEAK